ncbi:uncharacterized protein B0P05DRAFT_530483 [Gilbertella persicaria]|uniref:uncharacterized protein n=1 Tax=Gilbertella persicaria TaxID=101096 RepID=UPI002220ACE0|nr:uncharacterized protein B0P05DRAFT_530483 [Gilbertella persicaria]KAI8087872.1 hypothetical protein B0P05DRAFT_530483 [Gilbertella persicaria]
MTHLSDYSFLQRIIGLSYVFIWLVYRIQTTGGFGCLQFSKFKQGDLKSFVTAWLLIMLPFQLYYDIMSCKIKYQEGYAVLVGHIQTKPEILWTQADRDLVLPTDYSLCVGFSLQIGTLLLLQCFWKYLAKLVAKARFMSSKEFKFYIIMTMINIILFPVIQYTFSQPGLYDVTFKEIIPQLVYGIELWCISLLGGVSHVRFKTLLKGPFVTDKIKYFQELNLLLSIALFIFSTSFIILSGDGLTTAKKINTNKFASDLMICNINMMCILIWVLVILIIHPNKIYNRR